MLIADVAVPVPLSRPFSYIVPDSLAGVVRPGVRVACSFRKQTTIGVVLDVREVPSGQVTANTKPISAVLDTSPCVPCELLHFLQELASYYLAPIGEVIRLALPALERDQVDQLSAQGIDTQTGKVVATRTIKIVRVVPGVPAPKQLRGSAPKFLAHLRTVGEVPLAQLKQTFPNAAAIAKRLVDLGLAEIACRQVDPDPFFRDPVDRDTPPELTQAQQHVVDRVRQHLVSAQAVSVLLHGVTGSGKTEVYLRLIETCLATNKGALVLVPEIALTPQLVSRFRARFGDVLAVLHSGLTDRSRFDMWRSLRSAKVRVAIGARSALFAPVADLGLVIVDEEHDGSFKQEEGVRYQARDMALLRARRAGAVCLLGSATPSLESEALTRAGKLEKLLLTERAYGAARLPTVQIVDMRRTSGPGPSGNPLISVYLHRAIEQTLADGSQAILFLNRRGFAPSVLCEACGRLAECPHCAVSLTMHRAQGGRLRCHYCDYDIPMWTTCGACKSPQLSLIGVGTEQIEQVLEANFPQARIARLDRDVASGAASERVLERMRQRKADILVGTQMVTKGHDLPGVTLVGVLNADAALSLPDFRASERTFQLLVQVAGRAGRADKPGIVIVQTKLPDHPAIRFALNHDVPGFVEQELGNRCDAAYPPYARLALVRVDSPDEHRAKIQAALLAQLASNTPEARSHRLEVLGPTPAPLERLRGRYRFRIVLRSADRGALHSVAATVNSARKRADRLVRVSIDIDPQQML